MAKKMVHTLTVPLPDDFMDAAEVAAKVKPHLAELAKALKEAGIEHTSETAHQSVKSPSTKPRKSRGTSTVAAGA